MQVSPRRHCPKMNRIHPRILAEGPEIRFRMSRWMIYSIFILQIPLQNMLRI